MTLQKFYKSRINYAIHIRNHHELELMLEASREYWDELKHLSSNTINRFIEMVECNELCFSNRPGYSRLNWYIEQHYRILTLDDIDDINLPKSMYIVTLYGNIKEVRQN